MDLVRLLAIWLQEQSTLFKERDAEWETLYIHEDALMEGVSALMLKIIARR